MEWWQHCRRFMCLEHARRIRVGCSKLERRPLWECRLICSECGDRNPEREFRVDGKRCVLTTIPPLEDFKRFQACPAHDWVEVPASAFEAGRQWRCSICGLEVLQIQGGSEA